MNQKRLSQKICQEHEKRLRNFIDQRVDNEQDAEEILQETFIAAFESLSRFSHRSSLFTWLCAIAKHEIIDYYRKKRIKTILFSRLPWLENLASQALGPEQIFLRKEFEGRVKETMMNLSEGYQQVLRLKYYQGLTVIQIAERLNETAKTVESRLFRARKAFAKAFLVNNS
jgi:RNA polymerase sigma-70 factor (ECF subfamily)